MENARRVMKTSQALQAALIAPHVDSTTTPLSHQRLEKEQPQASTIGGQEKIVMRQGIDNTGYRVEKRKREHSHESEDGRRHRPWQL